MTSHIPHLGARRQHPRQFVPVARQSLRAAHAMLIPLLICVVVAAAACRPSSPHEVGTQVIFGSLERLHPDFDRLVAPGTTLERLARGHAWTEGPVWIDAGGYLLYSDIPRNAIYAWQEGAGTRLWLQPAGYTGDVVRGGESGSNGLLIDHAGRLLLCQHGDRRIARLLAPLDDPRPEFETLVERYEGSRLNSPNDVVSDRAGNLYFTDPPYGFEHGPDDPARELDFQGVYRLSTGGDVTLLTAALTRPNGIALSPDDRTLYVSNSDHEHPVWMALDLDDTGTVTGSRVLFDATALTGVPGNQGVPDGLTVDARGNLFATGPGGILVISPDGTHLGTIRTGQPVSNCAWGGPDRSLLYVTAGTDIARIQTLTAGQSSPAPDARR